MVEIYIDSMSGFYVDNYRKTKKIFWRNNIEIYNDNNIWITQSIKSFVEESIENIINLGPVALIQIHKSQFLSDDR